MHSTKSIHYENFGLWSEERIHGFSRVFALYSPFVRGRNREMNAGDIAQEKLKVQATDMIHGYEEVSSIWLRRRFISMKLLHNV